VTATETILAVAEVLGCGAALLVFLVVLGIPTREVTAGKTANDTSGEPTSPT
jgi:hypothetical protein